MSQRTISVPAGARAIAYLRVSTVGQQKDGLGLEVQRDSVTDYAAEHSLTLLEVVEEAASGGVREGEVFSYEHRRVLLSLMERAEAGEYDVLLVAKLDRLARDFATLVTLERRLEKYGVTVLSVGEENGDGPIADFIRGQLALVAQLERAQIRERLSAGKAKKQSKGGNTDGRIPYGYQSEEAHLIIDPSQVPIVRRIFRDLKEGYSPGRVARELNRDGIPSPWEKTWSEPTVRSIATNPAYAGERHSVRRAHPSIVSRQLFTAVQEALAERARRYGKRLIPVASGVEDERDELEAGDVIF